GGSHTSVVFTERRNQLNTQRFSEDPQNNEDMSALIHYISVMKGKSCTFWIAMATNNLLMDHWFQMKNFTPAGEEVTPYIYLYPYIYPYPYHYTYTYIYPYPYPYIYPYPYTYIYPYPYIYPCRCPYPYTYIYPYTYPLHYISGIWQTLLSRATYKVL
ncbi:hypothetical protein QTP86_031348, partial [Hemibagrus guttatus]